MADDVLVENPGRYEQLYRITSGGMRFKVKGNYCEFFLLSRDEPIYQVILGPVTKIKHLQNSEELRISTPNAINDTEFKGLWLSISNNMVRIGPQESNRLFMKYLAPKNDGHDQIGFIKFYCSPRLPLHAVQLEVEAPPLLPENSEPKKIEGGELRWVAKEGDDLPEDALIGGFEQEPSYIARAHHNNSLCPGKFLLSDGVARIPWGFREHRKETFEILCGYNAAWVKTRSNNIPENAFIAGYSEVRHEPLYIGRAMHQGHLLTGKVHALYKTCYLPYNGNEVEVGSYEILVQPNVPIRGVLPHCNNQNILL